MPVGEAELRDAWIQVLDRFPFPEYIKMPRNQLDVPRGLRRLYLAFSAFAPNTRDSWRLIARKPEGWIPKLELSEDEMTEYTGLTCWDDLGH